MPRGKKAEAKKKEPEVEDPEPRSRTRSARREPTVPKEAPGKKPAKGKKEA